ncbi:MAG: hypothetical protein H7222_08430 [Methylotenera sp.]|nr:hypothetical protein [Oligoflexia bacterium]
MKKKNVWVGLGAFTVMCAVAVGVYRKSAAVQEKAYEEAYEDTTVDTGKFHLIPPLKSDIRKVQAPVQRAEVTKYNTFRSPASAVEGGPRDAKLTAKGSAQDVVAQHDKATLYQAYRNTLLKLGKTGPGDQKLIQEILDFVQYAKPGELPVTQVVASNSGVALAAPIEEAKISDPELRAKWRQLNNIAPATTVQK